MICNKKDTEHCKIVMKKIKCPHYKEHLKAYDCNDTYCTFGLKSIKVRCKQVKK